MRLGQRGRWRILNLDSHLIEDSFGNTGLDLDVVRVVAVITVVPDGFVIIVNFDLHDKQ